MKDIDIRIALTGGYSFACDLCSQIIQLANLLKESDSFYSRGLKMSIILMSFNLLEGYSNFLAELAIGLNEGYITGVEIKNKLNLLELDLLKEQESKYNVKKYKIETKNNKFVSTLDKLLLTLTFLSKIYGEDYKLETCDHKWEYLNNFKKERDKLTHLKFNMNMLPSIEDYKSPSDIEKGNPTFSIDDTVLFNGIVASRWYFDKCALHLQKLFKTNMARISLSSFDLFLYKLLSILISVLNIDKDKFKESIEAPKTYETDYSDYLEESLCDFTSFKK